MRGSPGEGWVPVGEEDVYVGDDVLIERKHFKLDSIERFRQIASEYYRMTVIVLTDSSNQRRKHKRLVPHPNSEYPGVPEWAYVHGTIPAENTDSMQMWRKKFKWIL